MKTLNPKKKKKILRENEKLMGHPKLSKSKWKASYKNIDYFVLRIEINKKIPDAHN